MFTQWTWDFLLDKNRTDESQDLSVNNNGIYIEQKHEIFIDMWALKQQYGKCLRHRDEDCLWLLHCTLAKTLPLPWRNVLNLMTLETARFLQGCHWDLERSSTAWAVCLVPLLIMASEAQTCWDEHGNGCSFFRNCYIQSPKPPR